MPPQRLVLGLWATVALMSLYVYVWQRAWLVDALGAAMTAPGPAVWAVILLLGAVRGFTLVPSTMLVIVALPFVAPGPLLGLTLAGIMMSSSALYFCSSALGLDRFFEARYPAECARVKALLTRHEAPIIIGWSFFPLVPTDLICYVAGVMRVPFMTFLLSVTAGEGAICAAYIYGGDQMLRWLHLR